jgi:hypothetical protein
MKYEPKHFGYCIDQCGDTTLTLSRDRQAASAGAGARSLSNDSLNRRNSLSAPPVERAASWYHYASNK